MKKSSKSSLKKRSLDISLQHKNEASYEFSKKKKFCTWPILGLALKGLMCHIWPIRTQWVRSSTCIFELSVLNIPLRVHYSLVKCKAFLDFFFI